MVTSQALRDSLPDAFDDQDEEDQHPLQYACKR
jgi:hypothetical protein